MAHFVDLICPRCNQVLAEDRASDEVIVCNHCGYTHNRSDSTLESKHDRRFGAITVIGAILVIFAFIHVVQWDKYSIKIVPLEFKQLTHTATASDLQQIADICTVRMKYSCTEKALAQIVQKNPNDSTTLFALADLQRRLGQSDIAMANFKQYFALGGNDPGADFSYAQLLDAAQDYTDAQVYYQRTLLAKPGILQITVIQHYVAMLMKTHQTKEALALIKNVRDHSGPEGETFMASAYNQMTGAVPGE